MFHTLVSFVCYHFGSFGSFGYRVAKVGKFLEKGNLMTHLTLADISFKLAKLFDKKKLFLNVNYNCFSILASRNHFPW